MLAPADRDAIRASVVALHESLAPPARSLPLIDPSAWEGQRAPPRDWAWLNNIPARQATLLTGAGSSGKSLLGQQLATHVALGRPYLGVETRQAVSLYLTCEDDTEELHRRQEAICETLDVSFAGLSGKLHLVSLAGAIGNELANFDPQNRMETTQAWTRLRDAVFDVETGFIVLDNIAHLFAGNENIRNQVAAFCSLLNGLAAEANAAILFIGHPNKAGAEFSGSTAWENQVRSRLFLDRVRQDDGVILDPDQRVLTRGKANYAQIGDAIAFRWYRGAFVRDQDLSSGLSDTVGAHVLAKAQEDRFVACLAKATEERRASSPNRSASNYAPKMFASMPTGKGVGAHGFEAAMERLLDSGAILNGQRVYQRDNRAWVTGLGPAPTLAPTPAQTPAQECTKPSENPE